MSGFISIFTGSSVSDNPRLGVSVAVEFSGKKPISAYFLYAKDMSSQLSDLKSIKISVEKFKKDKTIYSKNSYAVNSFGLWLNKWRVNDWKGKDNKPIKNKETIKLVSDNVSSSPLFFSVELSSNGEQIDFCHNLARSILSDVLSGKITGFEQDIIYPVNLPKKKVEIIDM